MLCLLGDRRGLLGLGGWGGGSAVLVVGWTFVKMEIGKKKEGSGGTAGRKLGNA